MELDLGAPKVLELVLELKQYPILSRQIRERMRQEIFQRGVISPADFEQEVRQKAVDSQIREGLGDPLGEEESEVWHQRLAVVRDDLTDFYFAHNCPHDLFQQIVQEVIARRTPDKEVLLTFNPELAPWAMLFATGEQYESYPPQEKAKVQHHLQEIVVVLSKGMLSDQLDLVRLARGFLTIGDLKEIRRRRIGRGKIGGKAAGLMMAWKILQQARQETDSPICDRNDFCGQIAIPDSYFVGADVFYEFQALNGLIQYMNQKYKSREEIEAEYPQLRERYIGGIFPQYVQERLQEVLAEIGNTPIVVRSSSLLEDNFGFSFAGKYDSFFLPNQGRPEENLHALTNAISAVYASVVSPDALIYRRHMGLLDYDERMAILIQKVVGEPYKDYFFPALAGVAFSRNPFRWNQRIRREEGLVRLVWGLGTRAVDRTANDYPRMIALSHPSLRPEVGPQAIKYAQRFVDVINSKANICETLAVHQLMASDYPGFNLLASVDKGGYVQPILSLLDMPAPSERGQPGESSTSLWTRTVASHSLVLTFDNLIAQTDFVPLIKFLLQTLEKHYGRPVDIEFAVRSISDRSEPQASRDAFRRLPGSRRGGARTALTLLQCRPLSFRQEGQPVQIPRHVLQDDIIFSANRLVPQGVVSGVRYIVWIDPSVYDQIADPATKLEIARAVGHLNRVLEGENFVLIGPGRWGSSNLSLGVKVTYADIHNARMLIEVALARGNHTPEVSYGTHFFQDLVESHIYPLPLYPDDPETFFNWPFFRNTPNQLAQLLPEYANYAPYIKLIDIPAAAGGCAMDVIMNGEEEQALAYIKRDA